LACSSCGAHIRRLARQYPYKSAKPQPIPTKKETKQLKDKLHALQKYSTPVEEIDTKFTLQIDDLSVIHTE
jgi:hypothetical protein